jgi:hypothetical protein
LAGFLSFLTGAYVQDITTTTATFENQHEAKESKITSAQQKG